MKRQFSVIVVLIHLLVVMATGCHHSSRRLLNPSLPLPSQQVVTDGQTIEWDLAATGYDSYTISFTPAYGGPCGTKLSFTGKPGSPAHCKVVGQTDFHVSTYPFNTVIKYIDPKHSGLSLADSAHFPPRTVPCDSCPANVVAAIGRIGVDESKTSATNKRSAMTTSSKIQMPIVTTDDKLNATTVLIQYGCPNGQNTISIDTKKSTFHVGDEIVLKWTQLGHFQTPVFNDLTPKLCANAPTQGNDWACVLNTAQKLDNHYSITTQACPNPGVAEIEVIDK